jgi:hypothetical protein
MNCNDFHPKMRRSSCIPNGISQWNGARTDMASYLTGVRTRPQSQLVLANFDPHNDERKRVWDQVCNGTLAAHTSCIYSPSLHADEVLSIISSHTFLLSPRGVGLDCYRTYEALFVKSSRFQLILEKIEKSSEFCQFRSMIYKPVLQAEIAAEIEANKNKNTGKAVAMWGRKLESESISLTSLARSSSIIYSHSIIN